MRATVPAQRNAARHAHYPINLSDLAQALDHSDEGFALTDPEGNYVYINDAHLRIYGYERPQDLLGHSWRTLYTPEWVRHFEQAVLPILPRDLVWRGEVLGRRRNGTSFLAGVTLTLLPDGKITCNCRDESARRESPAKPPASTVSRTAGAADLQVLGARVITGLPAKLRRPLDMLAGYSAFLLSELEAERELNADSLRDGLNEIAAAERRVARQIRRLERVAQLVSCHPRTTREPEHRENWPCRLAEACREKAASAGRLEDFLVVLEEAALSPSYAELECIVLELLANALQFSRAGDAVQICGRRTPDGYVLSVTDEGVGLQDLEPDAPDSRPFGQNEPGGFGLDIVRLVLGRHGAKLEASQSQAGATCFKFSLPVRG